MPFLMPDVARLVIDRASLADVVVPMSGGRFETLHACYAKSCLGPWSNLGGRLKIAGFFDEVRVLAIPEEEVARFRSPDLVFMNVNTPEEWRRRGSDRGLELGDGGAYAQVGWLEAR